MLKKSASWLTSRRGLLCLLAVLFVMGLSLALFAQDPAPTSTGGTGGGEKSSGIASKTAFDIWVLGGSTFFSINAWQIIIIILQSIASIALIIEHCITIRRDKLAPPHLIVELEQLLDEEQYEEALNLCESNRVYITNVMGAALARVGEDYGVIVNACEGAAQEEALKLQHKISWINLLANTGPMCGLFGTVSGMVTAFTEIATSAQVTPQQLAGGIYTALVTTVWGLIVAIPALSAYFIFKNKVQWLALELGGIAAELVERLKPAEGKK